MLRETSVPMGCRFDPRPNVHHRYICMAAYENGQILDKILISQLLTLSAGKFVKYADRIVTQLLDSAFPVASRCSSALLSAQHA